MCLCVHARARVRVCVCVCCVCVCVCVTIPYIHTHTHTHTDRERLEVPMDLLTFRGGFAHCGTKLPTCIRHQPLYGISKYSDLDLLLGKAWHLRVLNKGEDFCYCEKQCVQYYLHQRKSVEEVDQDGRVVRCLSGGYVLVFKFVCMDSPFAQYPVVCDIQ